MITFSLIIFITTLLCHLFYERAWLFAIFIGHIAMILLLLFGRLIFELDYKIWRLFLEMILGIGCCYIYRFFRGIGDVSRIEKASFEDDEYFYYVKAVPKVGVQMPEKQVKHITEHQEQESEMLDISERESNVAASEVSDLKKIEKKEIGNRAEQLKKEPDFTQTAIFNDSKMTEDILLTRSLSKELGLDQNNEKNE